MIVETRTINGKTGSVTINMSTVKYIEKEDNISGASSIRFHFGDSTTYLWEFKSEFERNQEVNEIIREWRSYKS